MPKGRFYLPSLFVFSFLPSLSQLQRLKMIQIFRIRPHLDNAKITSSSELLQDTLPVQHSQAAKKHATTNQITEVKRKPSPARRLAVNTLFISMTFAGRKGLA